ncbi:hypothetical protein HOO31_02985 [Aliarcobacter cryaerophilus]|uniref:hypothetical protein n=1 Tax=Aliarcobacter cryaerophilus TaxID=28198 RepID=UPI00164B22D9|nr:hypothetical protein [Aliarcobacter cryaerophilus]QNK85587.1 hypothetical protein HOO31_02985 [Aliarcobacter cryaerophilus]
MIIFNGDKNHLVILPKNISKEKFLSHAKVREGSYFYKRLENVYIALTSSTINLEDEYMKYYSEYDTFADFIYYKYPYLDDNVRNTILDMINTKKYIFLRGYFFELSDYNLRTIMEHTEEFLEKINKLLKENLYED